jgi:hypothetical protein
MRPAGLVEHFGMISVGMLSLACRHFFERDAHA